MKKVELIWLKGNVKRNTHMHQQNSGAQRMIRFFFFIVAAAVPIHSAYAQNLAPELFIEGTCEELVTWASRPVEEIRADLDQLLGTETEAKMNESMYKTIMGVLANTAVSDAWFARPCSFSDEQLSLMQPLHDAYVGHMADKLAPG